MFVDIPSMPDSPYDYKFVFGIDTVYDTVTLETI